MYAQVDSFMLIHKNFQGTFEPIFYVFNVYKIYKTGVVNDSLGQPTARPAVEISVVSFDFENFETDGRTDDTCENSYHYRPCVGRPSDSIMQQYDKM